MTCSFDVSSSTSRYMTQISGHTKKLHLHISVEIKSSQLCHESVSPEQGSERCQWRHQFVSFESLQNYCRKAEGRNDGKKVLSFFLIQFVMTRREKT